LNARNPRACDTSDERPQFGLECRLNREARAGRQHRAVRVTVGVENDMANQEFKLNDYESRMAGVVDNFKKELGGLRTARASAGLLEPLVVDVYGQKMPINQVGSISVPEPRMLQISVWDKAAVSAVEKAIRDSNLGLNPVIDGTLLRLPIPPLTAERRQELVKIAHRYAESARVAVRNVRRDANDHLKKLEKDGDMSQDDHKRQNTEVQTLTDRIIKDIDVFLSTKEEEITTV
jgi:ribosome recycling factor